MATRKPKDLGTYLSTGYSTSDRYAGGRGFDPFSDYVTLTEAEVEDRKKKRKERNDYFRPIVEKQIQYDTLVTELKGKKGRSRLPNAKEFATSLIPFVGAPIASKMSSDRKKKENLKDPLNGLNLNKYNKLDINDIKSAGEQALAEKQEGKGKARKTVDFFTGGTQDYIGNLMKSSDSIQASTALEKSDLAKKFDGLMSESVILNRQKKYKEAEKKQKEAMAIKDSNDWKYLELQSGTIPSIGEGVGSAVMAGVEVAPWLSGFSKGAAGYKAVSKSMGKALDPTVAAGKSALDYYAAKKLATETGRQALKRNSKGLAAEALTYGTAETAGDVIRQDNPEDRMAALKRAPLNYLAEGAGEFLGYGIGRKFGKAGRLKDFGTARGAYQDDVIGQLLRTGAIDENLAKRMTDNKSVLDINTLETAMMRSNSEPRIEGPEGTTTAQNISYEGKGPFIDGPEAPIRYGTGENAEDLLGGILRQEPGTQTLALPEPSRGFAMQSQGGVIPGDVVEVGDGKPGFVMSLNDGPRRLIEDTLDNVNKKTELGKPGSGTLAVTLDGLDKSGLKHNADTDIDVDGVDTPDALNPDGSDLVSKKTSRFSDMLATGRWNPYDEASKSRAVLNGIGRAVQTMETRLAGQGPVGQKILRGVRNMQYRSVQLKQTFDPILRLADENPELWNNIAEELESGNITSDAARNTKKVLDQIYDLELKAGLDVKYRQKYFPRVLDPQKEDKFVSWAQEEFTKIEADPKAKKTPLFELIKKMQDDVNPKRGMAEFSRVEGIPEEFYVQDKGMSLAYYVDQMSDRIAEAEVWGGDKLPTYEKLASMMRAQYGKTAFQDVNKLMELTRYGAEDQNEFLQQLRSFQVLTKMGTSVFSNSTQSGNTIAIGGFKNFNNAVNVIRAAKAGDEAAIKELADLKVSAGLNTDIISEELAGNIHRLAQGKGIPEWADNVLTWTQFKRVEQFNRMASALTGKNKIMQEVDNLLKIGDVSSNGKYNYPARFLQQMGLDPNDILARQGIDDELLGRGIHEFVGRSQFYVSPKDLPLWVNKSQFAKTLVQLSQFGMKHGEFLKDGIIKEIGYGNFAPLMRYLGVMIPAGSAVMYAKNEAIPELWNHTAGEIGKLAGVDLTIEPKQRNTEEKELFEAEDPMEFLKTLGNYSKESLARAGGFGYLPGLFESMSFYDSPGDAFLGGLAGPTGGDILEFGKIVKDLKNGELEGAGERTAKAFLKRIPIVGSYAKQSVYPYDPKESEVYDMTKKLKLGVITEDDRKEFVKALRGNGDISTTNISRRLTSKIYDEKGQIKKNVSQKTIDEVFGLLEEMGIDSNKALSYKKEISEDKSALRKGLSDFEKLLIDGSSDEAQEILTEREESLEDYPGLKEYVDKYGW